MSQDDDDLVERFLRFDPVAEGEMLRILELLSSKLAVRLYLECRASSNARAVEPRDLQAAAYAKVFAQRARTFQTYRSEDGHLEAWLRRVARNAMVDVIRKNWEPWSEEAVAEPGSDPAPSILRIIDAERAVDHLRAELGPTGRLVFTHMFERGDPDEKVASELVMTVANVHLWRHRIFAAAEKVGIRLGLRQPKPKSSRRRAASGDPDAESK